MNKMRDFLDSALAMFDLLPTPVRAAILAGILTILRFAYSEDARKWKRKLLELGICVFTTFGLGTGLQAFGFSADLAYILAVIIGHEGADFVRERAKRWLDKKTGVNNEPKA